LEIRRVPATFQVACWTKNETSVLLRVPGKAGGTERWLRKACFFDNEIRLGRSDTRRRQDLANERNLVECKRVL
jgi:hypothetical protein